jgi:hypothetical protein
VTLTGNPVADMQMLYGLLTSGTSPFRLPTALDAATAFQLISSKRQWLTASVSVQQHYAMAGRHKTEVKCPAPLHNGR